MRRLRYGKKICIIQWPAKHVLVYYDNNNDNIMSKDRSLNAPVQSPRLQVWRLNQLRIPYIRTLTHGQVYHSWYRFLFHSNSRCNIYYIFMCYNLYYMRLLYLYVCLPIYVYIYIIYCSRHDVGIYIVHSTHTHSHIFYNYMCRYASH